MQIIPSPNTDTRLATINRYAFAMNMVEVSMSLKATFDFLNGYWDKAKYESTVKDKGGKHIILTERGTRVKYQVVQGIIMELIREIRKIENKSAFPKFIEMPDIDDASHWKVDMIVLQIANHRHNSYEEFFSEAVCSLYGVPKIIMNFIFNDFSGMAFKELLENVFHLELHSPIFEEKISLSAIQDAFNAYLDNNEDNLFV